MNGHGVDVRQNESLGVIAMLWSALHRFRRAVDQSIEHVAATSAEKAAEHMRQHYSRPISMSDLSRQTGISAAHLGRLFRGQYKTTCIGFLTELRLAHAREMMRQPELSITQIAYACGFRSLHYFSRTFSKHLGASPRAHRPTLREIR